MRVKMNPQRVAASCAALVALGVVIGLLFSDMRTAPSPETMPQAEVLYDRDYESMEDMLSDPDTVVLRGKVRGEGVARSVGDGVLFTDTLVDVTEVLYGALEERFSASVLVRQTGGSTEAERLEIAGQKLLGKGETVLLFLTYWEKGGLYFIVGGAHGYFIIDNGEVRPANLVDPDHDLVARHRDGVHPLAKEVEALKPSQLRSAFALMDD